MRIIPTKHAQSLLDAALEYASRGIPVLPCHPGTKVARLRDWPQRATTDPSTIRGWWTEVPLANVALLTGAPGYDVLDVDVRSGGSGLGALARLDEAGLATGASRVVHTPSGGLHRYFSGSDQRSGALPDEHLDFKARGGYVLAPPSEIRGDDGELVGTYRASDEALIGTASMDWRTAVDLLRPPPRPPRITGRRRGTASSASVGRMLAASSGQRNDTLFTLACRAYATGEPIEPLRCAAEAVGLNSDEVTATLVSAERTVHSRRAR